MQNESLARVYDKACKLKAMLEHMMDSGQKIAPAKVTEASYRS